MNIRKAEKSDCLNLVALSIEVWLHTYAKDGIRLSISKFVLSTFTEEYFFDLLEKKGYHTYVAIEKEHLVGYITINLDSHFETEENGYEIDTLYVQEHFHKRGFGKELLKYTEELFGGIYWLSTWEYNSGALEFYKYIGFANIGKTYFDLDGEKHLNYVLGFRDE